MKLTIRLCYCKRGQSGFTATRLEWSIMNLHELYHLTHSPHQGCTRIGLQNEKYCIFHLTDIFYASFLIARFLCDPYDRFLHLLEWELKILSSIGWANNLII